MEFVQKSEMWISESGSLADGLLTIVSDPFVAAHGGWSVLCFTAFNGVKPSLITACRNHFLSSGWKLL